MPMTQLLRELIWVYTKYLIAAVIFILRQLREKFGERMRDLVTVFIALAKA